MYPDGVRTLGPRDSTNLVFGRGPRVETYGVEIHKWVQRGESNTYDKICRNGFLSTGGDVTVFDLEVVNIVIEHQFHPTLAELGSDIFPPALWICIVQDEFLAMHDGDILPLFSISNWSR